LDLFLAYEEYLYILFHPHKLKIIYIL